MIGNVKKLNATSWSSKKIAALADKEEWRRSAAEFI
jgi:hypothetical protein